MIVIEYEGLIPRMACRSIFQVYFRCEGYISAPMAKPNICLAGCVPLV